MAGYTKEFLVDAYVSRYENAAVNVSQLREQAVKHYDLVGRDQFRVSASLDAQEIKKFKLATGRKSQYNQYSLAVKNILKSCQGHLPWLEL